MVVDNDEPLIEGGLAVVVTLQPAAAGLNTVPHSSDLLTPFRIG